ncbi:RNA exonuclease 4-like isoform X2 [Varroa jacobsoni]|uniref:RNA exonuclease 4-like isoform X2 n=1 Tax=Varroa jacobsoni TaxID=62625 RepID=UPI000BF86043|nr:RNA exonuclease 4-like isoform X2 [Varroa jacobsoni]
MNNTSGPVVSERMSNETKSRAEKLRDKRLIRKTRRKALLVKAAKTVVSRPTGSEGVSANWERLKDIMGIKKSESTEIRQGQKTPDKSQLQNPTKVLALDCEMVGVGPGGREHMLARITMVNIHGNVIYDKYVKPRETVVDYRTAISGIRPEHLWDGIELTVVQKEVSDLLKERIIVGHDLRHDFEVMFLSHPNRMTRDTSLFRPFREMFGGRTPSLKNLALKILDLNIQEGEHSSVQDAQIAMKLYLQYRRRWETEMKKRHNRIKRKLERRKEKTAKLSQDRRIDQHQRGQQKQKENCKQEDEGSEGDSTSEDDRTTAM